MPEKRRERVIVPITKKRNTKKVEEHRGITPVPTLYKIYAMLLAKKLRKEVKKKKIMPDNQVRFREGKEVIDNLC